MINRAKHFFQDIYDKRTILYELAKRDFQQQYAGSYLGFVWVFLQPLIYITILYLVFTYGFRRAESSDGIPFSVYLVSGMVLWLFFADNFSKSTNTIRQHSFLLKKVDFRLSILPMIKLMSGAVPHLFFMCIAIIVALINGIYPSIYTFQLLYYFFATLILLLGLGWLTSSMNIFVPDIAKIVTIFIQFGFWLTPIFWSIEKIPTEYQWIIKLNPVVYLIEGYRDSLIYHIPFWEKPYQTLYFWGVTLMILWIGITVFKKLRPHFAEVI